MTPGPISIISQLKENVLLGFNRLSAWHWSGTASGYSVGGTVWGPISASLSGGHFILTSPTQERVDFLYVYGGAGPGIGYKFGGSHSTDETYSAGDIYLSDKFSGPDVSKADFTGLCLVDEIAGGVGLGGAATIMLVGIPAKDLLLEAARKSPAARALQFAAEHPTLMGMGLTEFVLNHWSVDPGRAPDSRLFDRARDAIAGALLSDAKALVVINGFNSGPQVGLGASQGLGHIRLNSAQPPPPPPPGPKDIVIVQPEPKGLRLHLPNDVLFDFDQSTIKPTASSVLDQVAWAIAELNLPGCRISVEGHTDGIGKPDYNRQLSLRRARSVWHWLVVHKVIKASDSTVVGWGMSKPLLPNQRRDGSDDPAARARNRRVELVLTR
jgi:outer membrane protein OmpA-like peptidoglycan-associated protein